MIKVMTDIKTGGGEVPLVCENERTYSTFDCVECKSISTSISEIRLTQGVIRYEGVSQLNVG